MPSIKPGLAEHPTVPMLLGHVIDISSLKAQRIREDPVSIDLSFPVHSVCLLLPLRLSDYLFTLARYTAAEGKESRKDIQEK